MYPQQQPKKDPQTQINQKLMRVIKYGNIERIKQLISQGADINYVKSTYEGNTHTPLSLAVNSDFWQQKYIEVIQCLLKNGADHKYWVRVGGWLGARTESVFNNLASKMERFREKSKIRLIEVLYTYNVDLNQEKYKQRAGVVNIRLQTCLIFQLMNSCWFFSRVKELRNMYRSVNFKRLQKQKEEQLQQKFVQQYGISEELINFQDSQSQSEQSFETENLKKYQQVLLMKSFINLQVNVNSSQNLYMSRNEKLNQLQEAQDDNSGDGSLSQDKNYKMIQQYFEEVQYHDETLLHRFIMNNKTTLVHYLIQKGAQKTRFTFTIDEPFYPHQWPEDLRAYKMLN